MALSPLSDDETGTLLSALVQGEAAHELVARTAGNPLYAEQYARLVAEGGSLDDLPTTVQGIVAARLDGLPAGEKSLLQDVAVIGEIFWSGAVAAVAASDRWSVEERLLGLERRELIRRLRSSSVEDETEYEFVHVVVRDVTYSEIPRAERARKHLLAAGWIESLGRAEDRAEVLAHHYLEALALTRSMKGDATVFAEPALVALREAGDRASALSANAAAARFYEAALELSSPGSSEHARLLLAAGRARFLGAEEGEDLLEQASKRLRQLGDSESAADAECFLADAARIRADGDRAATHVDAAMALVEGRSPSPSIARILSRVARHRIYMRSYEEAITLASDALSMADAFGLDGERVEALNALGTARMHTGDVNGRADLERSIEIGTRLNSIETVRTFNNLGASLVALGYLREAASAWDEGREFGRRFGDSTMVRFLDLNFINQGYWSGAWDDALGVADALIEERQGAPHIFVIWAYDVRSRIHMARDQLEPAVRDATNSLEIARRTDEPIVVLSAVALAAATALASGRDEEASALANELLALGPARRPLGRFAILFDLSVVLRGLARAEAMLEEAGQAEVRTRWVEAAEAYARDDLETAAEIYAESGALPLEAYVRLGAAEHLVGEGRRADARVQLDKALAFWRSVDATRYIRQCEELLATQPEPHRRNSTV
jgi:tetratricopeptide (TPR) repeat protein